MIEGKKLCIKEKTFGRSLKIWLITRLYNWQTYFESQKTVKEFELLNYFSVF